MEMFCNQCEQAAKGTGCTKIGICGKGPEESTLQDLIIEGLKGLSAIALEARKIGIIVDDADLHVIEALFTTVTNVDFDAERLVSVIDRTRELKARLKMDFADAYKKKTGKAFAGFPAIVDWDAPSANRLTEDIVLKAEADRIAANKAAHNRALNEDSRSLREILLYGIKGMAAYADHAWILGRKNEQVNVFFHTALAALADDTLDVPALLGLVMQCGEKNLTCMEMLDSAHTSIFGTPEPTRVDTGHRKGPAILVSGHDLLDLHELLKQTEGTGINVYTHGEMLPAHGYPGLKKFPHLAGNYGGAWQDQQKEFEQFPGPILMTTNCIQRPRESYRGRIFTTGLVAFPGVEHIRDRKNFGRLLESARADGGFPSDAPDKEITVGFGHGAVLGVADTVVGAVKSGAIKHFFLVGGCDGAKPGRNYYTELAEKIPADCVLLTLACGKYRFNKLEFGDIGGIPRLLDIGQCNDAYSAVKIALALAHAFGTTVNELPLSIILSWYEQKAVAVLLTLLSLGIRNIKIGPTLPAFVSPGVLSVLVEKFGLGPITTPEADLAEALGAASK